MAGELEEARAALEAAIGRRDARAAEALRVRYASLEQQWRDQTRRRFEQLRGTAGASPPPATLSASIYPFSSLEQSSSDSGIGLCLSGGGSRAAAASMGALRGLRCLGLLDEISVLSTVSGGGWAGVPFTYLPADISDDEFLGAVVRDPRDLTWSHHAGDDPARALDVLSERALGSLCTRIGLVEFLDKAAELADWYHDSPHVLWCRAVGALILEPFGLGDIALGASPASYFSGTEQWLKTTILADGRNPALTAADFHLVREPGRPLLVTNSTLFWPPGVHPRRPAPGSPALELYPFEAASTQAGAPFPFRGGLGGGWIDPFAFGGQGPAAAPLNDRVVLATPPGRFSLSDIAGTSSSAFVGPLIDRFGEEHPWLQEIDPVYPYWPVATAGAPAARACYFGDGGNLENTGIMALLRRGISRIVAFVNAEAPLAWDPGAQQVVVDGQLPPLFGLQPKEAGRPYVAYPTPPLPVAPASAPFCHDQVFEPHAFFELIDRLWAAHRAGGSALCRQSGLAVRDNPRFGIQGVGPVDVLWVYNAPVAAFRDRLGDIVRLGMDADPLLYGRFPNYDTILQLHLTPRQVNLLAHLSCWNVINEQSIGGLPPNAEVFRTMFR